VHRTVDVVLRYRGNMQNNLNLSRRLISIKLSRARSCIKWLTLARESFIEYRDNFSVHCQLCDEWGLDVCFLCRALYVFVKKRLCILLFVYMNDRCTGTLVIK
jgi:hypothetical protein